MNSRLTTIELASLLAQSTGKDAEQSEKFIREFIALVDEGLFADRLVRVNSIGTFKIIQVEKRESIDVNTKERILIPEHFKLSFLPDKEMRTIVNKPFEAFDTVQIEEGTDLESLRTTQDRDADDEADEPDTDEIIKDPSPVVEEEPRIEEIAQEANEHYPTVIIKEDVPPISEEYEDEAPPPIPEDGDGAEEDLSTTLQAETKILPEDEMIPAPEPHIPPIPPPPDPPPVDVPAEEPEDKHDENTHQPDYEDRYDNTKNTEQNNLKEEYMDNFNGNRRKPGPVPYGPGTGGSLTNNVAAVILAVVIVVLVIVLAFMLLKPTKSKSGSGDIDRSEFSLPSQHRDLDATADGLGALIDDAPLEESTTPAPTPIPETKTSRKATPKAKAAPYVAQSSVTTAKGDRLNLFALKYYGDKVFWVYIYIANQTKLQNPDILPIGVTLTIPSSNEYDINRYNSLSLRKAYALQRDILNNKNSFGSGSSNGSTPRNNQYNQNGNGQYGNGNGDYGYDYDGGNGNGEYGSGSSEGYGGDYGSGEAEDYSSDGGEEDFGSYGNDSFDDSGFEGAKATNNKKPASGKSNATNQTGKPSTVRPAAPGRYL